VNGTPIAISIHGLGKRYRIGSYLPAGGTLRGLIGDRLSAKSLAAAHAAREPKYLWALKDLTLDVPAGSVIGIVGRNGVGKSTLLKILSRITDPTEGTAELYGKVASLLEVGTGFHGELTGRENIYLNGAITGMTRAEVDRRFGEIVAFSELEQFLDTPVKRYSSGMYVRLGFAVAAHLDPDILLVDEVLAVGDLSFQRRCLNRMNDVARTGRTVIFVSHQMTAIRRLCTQTVWLEAGRIKDFGPTGEVVARYENESLGVSAPGGAESHEGVTYKARYLSWTREGASSGENAHAVATLDPVGFRLVLDVREPVAAGYGGIEIFDPEGKLIWSGASYDGGRGDLALALGKHALIYTLPMLPLKPGAYKLHASFYEREGRRLLDDWWASPELIVSLPPSSHPDDQWQGILNLPCGLRVERA
jgi:ABC-type polysaccharide/polyol phosphate transport system ATPase subunit